MRIEINTGTAFQNFALEILVKIDVGSLTGSDNFDTERPVVLIMTIILNIKQSSNTTFNVLLDDCFIFKHCFPCTKRKLS